MKRSSLKTVVLDQPLLGALERVLVRPQRAPQRALLRSEKWLGRPKECFRRSKAWLGRPKDCFRRPKARLARSKVLLRRPKTRGIRSQGRPKARPARATK